MSGRLRATRILAAVMAVGAIVIAVLPAIRQRREVVFSEEEP